MQEVYLPEKFPKHIPGKVRSGPRLPYRADILLTAAQLDATPSSVNSDVGSLAQTRTPSWTLLRIQKTPVKQFAATA